MLSKIDVFYEVLRKVHTQKALSDLIGVKESNISKWKRLGASIPHKHYLSMLKILGEKVERPILLDAASLNTLSLIEMIDRATEQDLAMYISIKIEAKPSTEDGVNFTKQDNPVESATYINKISH